MGEFFFVSTLKIQSKSGGNLAQILGNIENIVRTRFELRREIMTLSAQGKLSGIVLVCMPIVIAAVLMKINPGYLNPLLEDALGKKLFICAIMGMLVGVCWINRIVNIRL